VDGQPEKVRRWFSEKEGSFAGGVLQHLDVAAGINVETVVTEEKAARLETDEPGAGHQEVQRAVHLLEARAVPRIADDDVVRLFIRERQP